MSANFITLCCLLLTFSGIALLGQQRFVDIACIATIALIFALDAVDGIVARKSNQTSGFGATFDTIADRIVENTFSMYCSAKGLIPFWFPSIGRSRGFLTDGMQRALLTLGNQITAEQNTVMNPRPEQVRASTNARENAVRNARSARALSSSRTNRSPYRTIKTLTFFILRPSLAIDIPTLPQNSRHHLYR